MRDRQPVGSAESRHREPDGGVSTQLAKLVKQLRKRTRIDKRLLYLRWRLTHPTGGYGEFYSHIMGLRLQRGTPHRTLSTVSCDEEEGGSDTPGWAKEEFSDRGIGVPAQLQAFGLKLDSVCVDYGCGTLRVGQHLMRLLPPGNYWGLDITDRFFPDALAALPPELVAESRPHLHAIGEPAVAALERQPPDFLFAYAVVKHVPPRELDRFFDGFMRLVGRRTIGLVYFGDAPAALRSGPMSWQYPAELLVGKVLARRPTVSLGITRIGAGKPDRPRHSRSVLWIAGSDAEGRMPCRIAAEREQNVVG